MKYSPYLIVGGGMAADAAVDGIRELDKESPIGLIGSEPDAPYSRPPLTKGLWKGKPLAGIWRKTEDKGVQLHLGRTVIVLDVVAKRVVDDRGDVYSYDKLLLATGGTPRNLPDADGLVIHYRNLADYRRLLALAEKGDRFAVIGGGFIASEIAAALAMNRKKVVLLFPGPGIGARIFPDDLSRSLNTYFRDQGVEVLAGETLEHIKTLDDRTRVTTGQGHSFDVDGVVAGIGIVPNVQLARSAGLEAEDGIAVDPHLRTLLPDVYAAGDVASFRNAALDARLRFEHEDNALTMGRAAGRNMAGAMESYDHLPYFYSDLFDLGYEAVGMIDPRMEVHCDWKVPFREGVVYYLRQGRVRGVLLWNVWGKVEEARRLIGDKGPYRKEDLADLLA